MKNPLANCRIAVSGNLPSSWTSAKLLGWIENNGGELEKGIKKSTTHLVCSEEAWLTPCDMVKAASTTHKHVKIVSFDWLEDCLQHRTRKRTDQYDWTSKVKPKSSTKSKLKTSSPRLSNSKSPVPAAPITPQSNKKKSSNGKTKKTAKIEETNIPVPKLSDTHHIYIDASNIRYDVKMPLQSSIERQGSTVRLQLYESNDISAKTYTCTSKYTSPGRETVVKTLAAEGSSYEAAMAVWVAIWEHKTGSAWA